MVDNETTIKRDRVRLRRSQNPQQIDFRTMRKVREVKIAYWATKKRKVAEPAIVVESKGKGKAKAKDKAKDKKKEPELEVIEEPEVEEFDEVLDEIYSDDEEDAELEEIAEEDEE
jgi:hypothetical protein